jgi:hypothetical protein
VKASRLLRTGRTAGAGFPLALCAPQASAHLVETGLGPVVDGVAHFALTPEELIPVLAIAALVGLRGADHARRAIVVLPLAWVLGSLVGARWGLPVLDALSWLPLLALGGLVAADLRLPMAATMAIAAAVGVFLGTGAAAAQPGVGARGVIGIAGAVFVTMTLCAASVVAWHEGWQRIAWRAGGSWIAASGLLLLGWSLR